MPSLTVRIDADRHRMLREMAAQTGEPLQTVLARAVEQYRRRLFLERVNQAYASLRDDPGAAAEWDREQAEWDGVLGDGLD